MSYVPRRKASGKKEKKKLFEASIGISCVQVIIIIRRCADVISMNWTGVLANLTVQAVQKGNLAVQKLLHVAG